MVALERLKLSHPKARLEEYRYVGRGMVALERLKPPARHLRDGGAVGRGMVALERLKLFEIFSGIRVYLGRKRNGRA